MRGLSRRINLRRVIPNMPKAQSQPFIVDVKE